MSEIIELVNFINATGGIPLTVTTTATSNWTQYITSIIFSSFMIIWLFGSMISNTVKTANTKLLLKIFTRISGRPVILMKHTEYSAFGGSMISQDTLKNMALAMNDFKGRAFDMILHTPGGEIFSALYLSRMLKQYPGKIRSIIPIYAMSGGTLLALSTDEIYMNPVSCLGPVDPQLGSLFKFGSARAWDEILKIKGKKADDSSITMGFMGRQYTKTIAKHLDDTIGFNMNKKHKKDFIKAITNGEVEHAYALTPQRLASFGLPIRRIPNKISGWLFKLIFKLAPEGLSYAK